MKKKDIKISEQQRIKNLFRDNSSIKLDIGCGENKQPGCIGVDFRKVSGVDIVQDLTMFPWKPLPDKCADVIYSSHLLEHINPASTDPRLAGLLDLLKVKRLITQKEVDTYIGEYRYLGGLGRFFNEVWRILKPGGQFISTFPYAGSPGYWQDFTHICPISHVTLAYFDPLAKDAAGNFYHLYTIYRPKPWKIIKCFYDVHGCIEVAMERREIDPSYRVSLDNGL